MLRHFVRKSVLAVTVIGAAAFAAPLNTAALSPAGGTGAIQGTANYSPGLGLTVGGSQTFTMTGIITGVVLGGGASVGTSSFSASGTESGGEPAAGVGSISMNFAGAISGGATGTMARPGPVPIIVLHGTLTILGITECYDIGIAGYFQIQGPPPAVILELAGWVVLTPGTDC